MSALPALSRTGELRALDVVDVVPDSHVAILVRNHHNMPHLKPGELAIVDTADRDPQHGEVYAIRYSNGPTVVQVVFAVDANGNDYIMCTSLNRPRSRGEFDAWVRAGRTLAASDGPYDLDHLRSKLIGRVVGVMVPT